jgi:hypothetical protein
VNLGDRSQLFSSHSEEHPGKVSKQRKSTKTLPEFEDLRRGDGVGGSLYGWRDNCAIGAIFCGSVWV